MRALARCWAARCRLEVYEQTRKRLVGQLGVEPWAELAALHLDLLRDDPPAEPGPRTPAAGPAARSPAARHQPACRAHQLRRPRRRAPAGRRPARRGPPDHADRPRRRSRGLLAVEAARAELGAMPDGVWLVELAPVTDPADVTSTVLSTLGLREQVAGLNAGHRGGGASGRGSRPTRSAACWAALAGRRTLLVLDNCEHLVAAAATLANRVLAACPQVRIMATSREPLNITGEALWTVGPLTLSPDPATPFSTERAVVHDPPLVRLLTQRAVPWCPDSRSRKTTRPPWPRLPGARRHAAGHRAGRGPAAHHGPGADRARLGDRFQLLASGSRTSCPGTRRPPPPRVGHHVVPADRGVSAVGPGQRGEDPHSSGLSCAVRA